MLERDNETITFDLCHRCIKSLKEWLEANDQAHRNNNERAAGVRYLKGGEMTIYQLKYHDNELGYFVRYYSNIKDAKAEWKSVYKRSPDSRSLCGINKLEFKPTVQGILYLLNFSTPHTDNG